MGRYFRSLFLSLDISKRSTNNNEVGRPDFRKFVRKFFLRFRMYLYLNIVKNPLPANYGKASISLSKNQAFGANDIPICIITFV